MYIAIKYIIYEYFVVSANMKIIVWFDIGVAIIYYVRSTSL